MPRKVWLGAAVVGAAALVFGSVQSTGALWRDDVTVAGATVRTGTLSLATGSPSGSDYVFSELTKNPVALNEAVQAPLVITNTGDTPLRFRLSAAGPAVSTANAAATVSLAGAVLSSGATCSATTPMGTAFGTFTTSAPTTAVAPLWQSLAKGASQTWCIRTTLTQVTSTSAVAYTHRFAFAVEQTR
ncbi:hypothetical protein [Rhodococcus sp. SORGH_AS_0301]|uniref:hypothetical protein n=1 Tax=Rhodococcus sp. SORGH_AS_0301 TaxID=3041780 RepID=UPI002781ED44|nr:hypothetical protein [Rhodococcus sp. SORGH_AS_0301]MDQ1179082.1 hypothetical protein [Rhodococcus sp. SORGH_AS_0301]